MTIVSDPWASNPSAINEVRVKGDSCGGEVTCIVRNCPKGLGVPVFDKLEAELAKAMMSLPASKVCESDALFQFPVGTDCKFFVDRLTGL